VPNINAYAHDAYDKKHHLDRRAHQLVRLDTGHPDDLLSTKYIADWFGVSVMWVENGRLQSYGPPFLRIGPRMIRYRRADVLAWLETRANASRGANE
jgi:predicted DNA-binding transcriptional regulator AlpA